ncbi:FAD-dependent oxidoreductase [Bacillota bacterium LX-D]|nr:FAD-dependent oxidoreductase [Bacillota bacterium LX-D]
MQYVIIGSSAAGISAVSAIRELDPKNSIIMISKDKQIYSRCQLPEIITGERTLKESCFIPANFFEKYRVKWIDDTGVTHINTDAHVVETNNGQKITFDRLLIATGASSFFPPIDNLQKGRQICGLRNIDDALQIVDYAHDMKKAVIIGAGLVGVEAALALNDLGLKVTLVENASHILPLQLDQTAAGNYERLLNEHQINIYTNEIVTKIHLDEKQNVTHVELKSGVILPADLIIVATGITPNIQFLDHVPIKINRGIIVNEKQETSIPNIYAAGDVCASTESFTAKITPTPIWPLAIEQGRIAGTNMAGGNKQRTINFAYKNSMNLFGLSTISYGFTEAPNENYTTHIQFERGSYKKLIIKDGILFGAIFQGDISGAGIYGKLIAEKISINSLPPERLFSISYANFFNQQENGLYRY